MLRNTVFFVLLAVVTQGQPASSTTGFDVASIKPNMTGERGGGGGYRVGRFDVTNLTLKQLIAMAYDVRDLQIIGGPAWLATERYNIAARTDPSVSREAAKPMIRALLEERFQLKIHHDIKELPVYTMVVEKNGPKFKPSTAEQSGEMSQGAAQGKYRVSAQKMPISVLATLLENQLGRNVIDKTGLEGFFNFKLEWALDLNGNTPDVSGPSVFTAVQEQLGLKLEAAKAPVDVIVIDRAEKASEN